MTIAYVRRLIGDQPVTAGATPAADDDTIRTFISAARGNNLLAAANLLRAEAVRQALILKVLSIQGEETDGAKLADALGKQADAYEFQATERMMGY